MRTREKRESPKKKKTFASKLVSFVFFLLLLSFFAAYFFNITPSNFKEFFSDPIHHVKDKFSSYKNDKDTDLQKSELQPLPVNPFAAIDAHVKNCPAEAEESIESLSAYLGESATTDLEKARAIYVWLALNIKYDYEGYKNDSYTYNDEKPKNVLKNKTAVCAGFANLYEALGKKMGLEIKEVGGYSKGYGYSQGKDIKDTGHAWNAIKIDGEWKLFDATWGIPDYEDENGNLISQADFDDYWFDTDSYEFIFSHYPDEKKYQLLEPQISLTEFANLADIGDGYFKLGFNAKETFLESMNDHSLEYPDAYGFDTYVKIKEAPRYRYLTVSQSYAFELYVPRAYSVALIDAKNEFTYFTPNKGKFTLDYIPKNIGKLKLSIQYEDHGESFWAVLAYEVKKGNPA